jgi:hypothetical protein
VHWLADVVVDDQGVGAGGRRAALYSRKHDVEVQFYAFDMLAGEGDDMRRLPLSIRKANLARLLSRRTDRIFSAPFEQGEKQPLLSDAVASNPEKDRCLRHPMGSSQIQADGPLDQGRKGLVRSAAPRESNTLLPIGPYATAAAEHREPYESRGSRPVLGTPEGESPSGDSSKCEKLALSICFFAWTF